MSGFSFIHAADLHLDSPLLGLSSRSSEFAARVEQASRDALDNLVDLAVKERCRFVLLAGDVFDGELRNIKAGLFFVSRLRRLNEAGVSVFMILGNHDAENRFMSKLEFPDNVHLFSARSAETKRLEDVQVSIHGRSFPQRDVSENIAQGYPAPVAGDLNIGVLHTACANIGGEHAPYAPCSVEQLRNHGYDYWALGHIHDRQILNENPPILFSGNLQGRSVRECGVKGATVVRVSDGVIESFEHRQLDTVRWANQEVQLEGVNTLADAIALIRRSIESAVASTAGLPLALRLRLVGETPIHGELVLKKAELRDEIETIATTISDDVWLEKLVVQTNTDVDHEAFAIDPTIAGGLRERVISLGDDADFARRVTERIEEIRLKFPAGARPDDLFSSLREGALARAQDLAIALLSEGGPDDAL